MESLTKVISLQEQFLELKRQFPHLVTFALYFAFAAICIQKEEVVFRTRRLQMARRRSWNFSEGDDVLLWNLHKISTI